jgi:hypothetical protein
MAFSMISMYLSIYVCEACPNILFSSPFYQKTRTKDPPLRPLMRGVMTRTMGDLMAVAAPVLIGISLEIVAQME